jgi:hypothetical protein
VLLDDALIATASGVDLLGRRFIYRAGASTHDVGSLLMTEIEGTVSTTALKPRSPAHLSARRTEGGIAISWIRRTRMGGDSWDTLEVPLGEESERYRVEILDGGEVVRKIETAEPHALYASSDEIEDFSTPQNVLAFRVSQLSSAASAGHPRSAVISL